MTKATTQLSRDDDLSRTYSFFVQCNRLSDIEPAEVKADVEVSCYVSYNSSIKQKLIVACPQNFLTHNLNCLNVNLQQLNSTPPTSQFFYFPAGPAGKDTDWERVDQ